MKPPPAVLTSEQDRLRREARARRELEAVRAVVRAAIARRPLRFRRDQFD